MKKKWCLALLAAVLLSLSGCGREQTSDKLQVVASIFPEYDWVRQIIGEDESVELTLLVDDGMDPHSFQPSVQDMVKAAQCDLLIYGGGESDRWLGQLQETREDRHVIELLPLLGERVHAEQIVPGMEHDHTRQEEAHEDMDEHVWLSLRNAAVCCTAITGELCALNPEKEALYRENLENYLAQLEALDRDFQQMAEAAEGRSILVCDRFPFRYLAEDYGLDYYAAFPGCSAETGASFETVVFLAEKMKTLHPGALLITETGDGKLAATVAENAALTDTPVLVLHSMQSVSAQAAEEMEYLSIMEQNRQVLEQALG